MNSFSTSADTLAYLEKYASDGFADPAQVELMQNRVPKILADGSPRPVARNSRNWNGARPATVTCTRRCWAPAGWTACWRTASNTPSSPTPTIWAHSLT